MSNEEEGTPEEFAKKMAEHGYSAMEQAIGVENSEALAKFNELRIEDGKAEVQKTWAEVAKAQEEVTLIKTHTKWNTEKARFWDTLTTLLILSWVVLFVITAVPTAILLWKAVL